MILRSLFTMPDGSPKLILGGSTTDHRSPFEHMTNLITRVGWKVRCALYDKVVNGAFTALLRETSSELVDYLLFVDEAPLPGPVHGTSGFGETFAAQGPWDSHGRSLRQLDLGKRLLR
jgi:hypothetical protein